MLKNISSLKAYPQLAIENIMQNHERIVKSQELIFYKIYPLLKHTLKVLLPLHKI